MTDHTDETDVAYLAPYEEMPFSFAGRCGDCGIDPGLRTNWVLGRREATAQLDMLRCDVLGMYSRIGKPYERPADEDEPHEAHMYFRSRDTQGYIADTDLTDAQCRQFIQRFARAIGDIELQEPVYGPCTPKKQHSASLQKLLGKKPH